jgi:predicted permease
MAIFTALLLKMVGLYLTVGIGFFAARKLHLNREGISGLLFYIIVPLVFLHGVSKMQLHGGVLLLPPLIMLVSSLLCLITYVYARRLWPDVADKTANILAFSSGNGNIGYFGIPVAMMLFSPPVVATYMVMIIGIMLYEATLGYYITAKGDFHLNIALKKILTLPMLHGSLGGLLLAVMEWPLPAFLEDFFVSLRGAYVILGMMMVGMGLAGMQRFRIDWKFTLSAFFFKFAAWPLSISTIITLDKAWLGFFTTEIHQAMLLLSLAPMAVTSVIYATLLKAEPEKTAAAVFLSTLFAIFYVPLMISWLGIGHLTH